MLKLSNHFIQNWIKRVGPLPSTVDVIRLLRQAVRIQKGRQIRGRTAFIKTLSIYWHADKDIVITVDHYTDTVVSVYSKANMAGFRPVGECLEGC